MELANELTKGFAALLSNTEDRSRKDNFAYGVVKQQGEDMYVQLDGAETLTPCSKAMDAESGDRVMVMIKDRSAVIAGNITSPASARTATKYMKLTDEGLVIGSLDGNGNPSGTYSLTAPGAYKILDSNNRVLASFSYDRIELGSGTGVFTPTSISLKNGMTTIDDTKVSLGKGLAVFKTDSITLANGMATITGDSVSLGKGAAVFKTDSISLASGMTTITKDSVSIASGMTTITKDSVSLGKGAAVIRTNSINLANGMTSITADSVSLGQGAAVIRTNSITLANGMATITGESVSLANGLATFSSSLLVLGNKDNSEIRLCNGKGSIKLSDDILVIKGQKAVGFQCTYSSYRGEVICRADSSNPTVGIQALDSYNRGSAVVASMTGVTITTPNSSPLLVNGYEIPQSNNLTVWGRVTASGNIKPGKVKSVSTVVTVPSGYSLIGVRDIRSNYKKICMMSQFFTDPTTNTVGVTFVNVSESTLPLQVTIEWFAVRCKGSTSVENKTINWGNEEDPE